jgi:hypothetical protein
LLAPALHLPQHMALHLPQHMALHLPQHMPMLCAPALGMQRR